MSSTPSTSSLISYPAASPAPPPPPAPPPAPAHILKDRLYVGNLHPTVDEYTLLQLFARHGRVSKLDFLFHKAGPAKGRPRGYAFVEFAAKEDALKALVALHDRLVRGRKLVVTFAHQAPQLDAAARPHRRATDTSRPTTLSLLKTHNRPEATQDKIAALEAKLRQMAAPRAAPPAGAALPPRPLLAPAPAVPAGGVQRRRGGPPPRTRAAPPRPVSAPPRPVSAPPRPVSAPPSAPTAAAGSSRPSSASLGIAMRR